MRVSLSKVLIRLNVHAEVLSPYFNTKRSLLNLVFSDKVKKTNLSVLSPRILLDGIIHSVLGRKVFFRLKSVRTSASSFG